MGQGRPARQVTQETNPAVATAASGHVQFANIDDDQLDNSTETQQTQQQPQHADQQVEQEEVEQNSEAADEEESFGTTRYHRLKALIQNLPEMRRSERIRQKHAALITVASAVKDNSFITFLFHFQLSFLSNFQFCSKYEIFLHYFL